MPRRRRAVRARTLQLKELDFVMAARALGASSARVLVRHLLPNLASVVIVVATTLVAQMIVAESTLSFLGLGPQVDHTWGAMLEQGTSFLWKPGFRHYALAAGAVPAPVLSRLSDVTGPLALVLGAEDETGGPVRVHVETRSERPECPSCGGLVWSKDQRPVELVDLAAFGRPARLVWHKRRWSCPAPSCPVGSFTETAPHIAAARVAMTEPLRHQLLDGHPQELRARVAEEPLGGRVGGLDDAVFINRDDGIHRRLHDGSRTLLAGLERRLEFGDTGLV